MKLFTLLIICLSLSLTACSKDNGKNSNNPCETPDCTTDNGNGNTDGDDNDNGDNEDSNNGNADNSDDETDNGKENLLKQISAIDPYSDPIALTDKDTLISDTRLLFGEKHDDPIDIAIGEKVNDVLDRLGGK
jgi:hypothetical protein